MPRHNNCYIYHPTLTVQRFRKITASASPRWSYLDNCRGWFKIDETAITVPPEGGDILGLIHSHVHTDHYGRTDIECGSPARRPAKRGGTGGTPEPLLQQVGPGAALVRLVGRPPGRVHGGVPADLPRLPLLPRTNGNIVLACLAPRPLYHTPASDHRSYENRGSTPGWFPVHTLKFDTDGPRTVVAMGYGHAMGKHDYMHIGIKIDGNIYGYHNYTYQHPHHHQWTMNQALTACVVGPGTHTAQLVVHSRGGAREHYFRWPQLTVCTHETSGTPR